MKKNYQTPESEVLEMYYENGMAAPNDFLESPTVNPPPDLEPIETAKKKTSPIWGDGKES